MIRHVLNQIARTRFVTRFDIRLRSRINIGGWRMFSYRFFFEKFSTSFHSRIEVISSILFLQKAPFTSQLTLIMTSFSSPSIQRMVTFNSIRFFRITSFSKMCILMINFITRSTKNVFYPSFLAFIRLVLSIVIALLQVLALAFRLIILLGYKDGFLLSCL